MNNQWLAQYLEEQVIKDYLNSRKMKRRKDFLAYWLTLLKGSRRLAAHEWNNLACIIQMAGETLGKNYGSALHYCKVQVYGIPTR